MFNKPATPLVAAANTCDAETGPAATGPSTIAADGDTTT
jgi:hypothetical protein